MPMQPGQTDVEEPRRLANAAEDGEGSAAASASAGGETAADLDERRLKLGLLERQIPSSPRDDKPNCLCSCGSEGAMAANLE